MQTLKIKYYVNTNEDEIINDFRIQYSSCLHFMFNRVKEGLSETYIIFSKSLKLCIDFL